MAQDDLQRLQQLIGEGRFDEARALVQSIDRPEAAQLLTLIDQMEQTAQQAAASAAAGTTPLVALPSEEGDLLSRLEQEVAAEPAQAPPQVALPQASSKPPAGGKPPSGRKPPRTEGGQRIHDEGTYQMLWDCQYCDTKKLLGTTHRFCPNCGAAQNPAARYFPAEGEYVAVEDHEYVGADKTCASCNGLNSAAAEFCTTCGAPLSEAAQAQTLGTQIRQEGEQFASSGSRDIVQERFDSEMERVGVKPKAEAGQGGMPRWLIIVIILGVLLCIGAIVSLFWTKEAPATVVGHSWQREVMIEQYGPQPASAWCDSVPLGAYNMSQRREVRDYRQVPDGEECETQRIDQGDGTFRQERVCHTVYRDEPIYDDKCYFTINTWSATGSVPASGDSLKEAPYWPQVNLACEGQARIGCERIGSRSEQYLVHLRTSDGKDFQCSLSQANWQAMSLESGWNVQVGVVDGSPRCDTLQPAG